MRQVLFAIALLGPVAACATPGTQFIPSQKSAVELRAMQVRTVPAEADTTMRGVIATLHDLGYRITRVESDARTVSATRRTSLRMAVVVQPRGAAESTVRANASIGTFARQAQVDSSEFYQRDFFEPLQATMHRTLAALPMEEPVPEAVRPVAELNTAGEREAAASRAAAPMVTPPLRTQAQ